MVLIDATNYVYKCTTKQVTTIQIWVSLYGMEALSEFTRKELTGYDPLRQ